MRQIPEPFLPADLEEAAGDEREIYAKCLRALAGQLGVGNDFFYPLIGSAGLLEKNPTRGPDVAELLLKD